MSKDCTVIIPAYNAGETITESLKSLRLDGKSLYSFEILIVNDGSTDNTADAVNKCCDGCGFVKLINKANGGVSSARNEGLKNATGRYVYFMDADDECNITCLEKMIGIADESNVSCVIADYNMLNLCDGKTFVLKNDLAEYGVKYGRSFIEQTILRGFFEGGHSALPSLCNKLYRLSLIRDNTISFDEGRTHGEDWRFNIDFFEKSDSVCFVDDILFTYKTETLQSYQKYSRCLRYSFLDGYDRAVDLNNKYGYYDCKSDEYLDFNLRFLRQILDFLHLEGIDEKEKKLFIKSSQVQSNMKFMASIPVSKYAGLGISRRSKLGFVLLEVGLYKPALKLIIV